MFLSLKGSLNTKFPRFKGILDIYAGASAAYSLRKLASGISRVVRVRRASDNAEADFKASEVSDGTLVAWVGAGNDGFVETWYDQSGNGNDATQQVSGSQPKIVDAGSLVTEGGLPSLDFTTEISNLRLEHSDLYGQATLDSFYVTSTTNTSYIYPACQNVGDHYGMLAQSGSGSSNITNNYGSPSYYANGSEITPLSRDNIYTATSGGQKLVTHIGADTTSSSWGTKVMNFGNYSNSTSLSYTGKLQEMIFYNSDQSANRVGIETNINNQYDIY